MTVSLPGSFRDPSGFLFTTAGTLYRQVNASYRQDYDALVGSGLYDELSTRGDLVRHREESLSLAVDPQAYRVLQPERIDFISYPYEWSFSQLRDAALHTLAIQQTALDHGMWLKDASAYNIQWDARGRPVLIDTLSFERYEEGRPWVAYRQFCQHFLAPLALMCRTDVRLSWLSRIFIDGVPLDLASRLLPRRSWFAPGLLTHLHLHARTQQRYAGATRSAARVPRLDARGLRALLAHLESTVRGLSWEPGGTEWGEYYQATNYTDAARDAKRRHLEHCLDEVRPKSVWDLGGNTGIYSRLASSRGIPTICFDIDPSAVEQNYRAMRQNEESNLLPLVLDLTNPSPSLGWASEERDSLLERGPCEMLWALALIHHLAIANNVPLARIAALFAAMAEWLVIEFVPKADSQVQRLLTSRKDIFPDYHEEGFRAAFQQHFTIRQEMQVDASERTVYLMRRRS